MCAFHDSHRLRYVAVNQKVYCRNCYAAAEWREGEPDTTPALALGLEEEDVEEFSKQLMREIELLTKPCKYASEETKLPNHDKVKRIDLFHNPTQYPLHFWDFEVEDCIIDEVLPEDHPVEESWEDLDWDY